MSRQIYRFDEIDWHVPVGPGTDPGDAQAAADKGVGRKFLAQGDAGFDAPGIVDVHTHYDPQITFDPYATVSCFHGVTTVLAGNCGFSVAPCAPADRSFLSGIFARVENMDPIALSSVRWDESASFGDFL